jgi:hypothetical protein
VTKERPDVALHGRTSGLTARGLMSPSAACGHNARQIATVSEALNRSATRERKFFLNLESFFLFAELCRVLG